MRLTNPISFITEPVFHGVYSSSSKTVCFLILLRLVSAEHASERQQCGDGLAGLSEETSLLQLGKPNAADLSLRAAINSKPRADVNTSERQRANERSTMVDHASANIDAQWSKLLPRDHKMLNSASDLFETLPAAEDGGLQQLKASQPHWVSAGESADNLAQTILFLCVLFFCL